MKDRNGVEFQVGDVCVDHWKGEGGCSFGHLCVVEKLGYELDEWPMVYTSYDERLTCSFQHVRFLEIIGDVR